MLKQFGAGGYGGSDNMVTDEVELQQHQKLEKLYISTRAGKVTWFLCTNPLILFCFTLTYTLPSLPIMTCIYFFQHYQRDIVRGVEGYIVTGSKQVEIG